jgi:Fe-S cluster assembly protein SufB
MTDLKNVLEEHDNLTYDLFLKWLNEETVTKISQDQHEPDWMLQHRLKCLEIFRSKKMPTWWPDLSWLNLDDIVYYAKASKWTVWYADNWDNVDPAIKAKFDRLWIPEAERKYLAGAWGQFDSEIVYHNLKAKRAEQWVIFEDMAVAVSKHSDLVKKYFMRLVPAHDHVFAALHGAVWSWGTFIYIPSGIHVTEPLQAYFRMNTLWGGQFEHTLIVIEDDATGDYIEWCSAPKFDKKSLHAWLVEIFVWKRSRMRYSSVENWSTNTYNLNTKRSIVDDDSVMEWINWNLGSCTTMLYPCTILKWKNSKSDNIGVVVAWKWQNQDTGSKVVHIGENSSSTIISKSISKDGGVSVYRGLVEIKASAKNAVNSTECDALLMDDLSVSTTLPSISTQNDTATVAHEASAGKVDETTVFYMMSRGMDETQAMAMIVNGFISPVVKRLPLEYAGELNKLIEMEMEGSVG